MNVKLVVFVMAPVLLCVGGTHPLWASPVDGGPEGHLSPGPASEPGPPPDCGRNAIAQAMRDVFPPATAEVRAASADTLRVCRPVGAEGVLAAAVNQPPRASAADGNAEIAVARALATFRSPVALSGLRTLALAADRPSAVREVALPALAAEPLGTEALVTLLGNVRDEEGLRLTALDLLIAGGRPPDATYLKWLKRMGTPRLRQRAQELLAAAPAPAPAPAPSQQSAPAPLPTAVAAAPVSGPHALPPGQGADHVAAAAAPRVGPHAPQPTTAAAPPPRTGPRDGTALGIGASTVAGGALMLNLSLLGFQDTTPQLLLGSAGAVIGFGTSWALSRFGMRPTLEQAAWFTNTTAWGTLAGLTMYQGSGADNYKLRYFSLVAGEVTGMAAGVWSARRWNWTGEQIVMSDSLFLGAALAGLGADRFRNETPQVTPGVAVAVVPLMVGAAVAGHALQPSGRDVALMTSSAVAGGWVGGLAGSGAARTELFGSRQGQGGLLLGLGLGYLGGAAAGPFTEVAPLRLRMGGAGLLVGNALGYGVDMLISGLRRHDSGMLEPGDAESWKLGAGIGGVALGSAAFALAPRLRFGDRAVSMTAWGAGYAAGTYWLALAASDHGQPKDETTDAVMRGGLLATAVAGGVGGLLLSGDFAPDAAAQWTTFGATTASVAAAWGATALLVDRRGAADGIGVTTGATLGLTGGALFTHFHARLRPPSLGAAAVGASYGTLLGALAPSLTASTWRDDRSTGGAAMLGLGGGALLGATLGEATGASAGQVAVPAVAGTLGLGVGTGAGLLFSDSDSQPTRVGAAVGTASFLGGSMLLDHWLRLSDGLGAAAPGMALLGGGFGAMEGAWLAGLLDDSGTLAGARNSAVGGGVLLGASAGIAGGLVLSRRWAPPASDLLLTAGNSLLLASAGYGLGELVTGGDGRETTAATMSGAAVGLVGGALIAPHLRLTAPVVEGSMAAAAAAGLVGTLAPSLGDDAWIDGPRTDGGLRLGVAAGLLGGGAAAQLTGATVRETTAVTIAGTLGLGLGLGAGSMWPDDSTRPERIGTVVGVAAAGTAGALLLRPLHLAEPGSAQEAGLVVTTTAHGIFDGLLLAALLDPSGLPSTTPGHQLQGGALFGGSLGLGAGLLLAPRLHVSDGELFFMSGVTVAGASMGRGVALLTADQSGRGDSAATLLGAAAGTAAGGWAAAKLDARPVDATAALLGAGYGGLLGALAPSLADQQWPGWNRATTGGLFLGAGTGAVGAVGARLVSHADDRQVGLTGLAGADGALTGLGWALLLSDDADSGTENGGPGSSRHLRLGAAAGTAAGLGLGMTSWARLRLGPGDSEMIAAAMALAGWNGLWIPALGHASAEDFQRPRMSGGLLAAAGTASFAGALLAPVVELDADAITNAVTMDAVFSGAGAGVGALVSARADAPVAGLLAGGAAGLVLGGALHRQLEVTSKQAPLLTTGAMEGLWFGAWAPYLLRAPAEITDQQRAGGVAAGTFGGLGLAALTSTGFAPSGGDAGFAVLGSGVGAAIGGGVALISEQLQDQQAVGLMLAGTGLGLGAGSYFAPRLHLDLRAAGAASLGGALGTSEALLFAWSSRADGGAQYAGAGLLGAGVGTALGLATNATLDLNGMGTPAVAGFTAWGAWMGAFAGSLFARDAHDITAGGLIGSNLGLLAGYGLLRTGAVDPGDFGWLSLFGAVGTVAGAAAGAPFASRGEPRPILGGLAVGPAVGMAVGALVLPHLRAVRDAAAAAPTVAWRSRGATVFSPYSLSMRGADERVGADANSDSSPQSRRTGRSRGGHATAAPTSVDIARELEEEHRVVRSLLRALDASIRISDCAPLIGALPTPDSASGGTTSPFLVGLTGRWQ